MSSSPAPRPPGPRPVTGTTATSASPRTVGSSVEARSGLEQAFFAPGPVFTAVELQQMARDQLLDCLFGSAYLARGVPVRPEHRALAMSLTLPAALLPVLTLGRLSAAWVFTGEARPPRVTALLDHRRRSGTLPPFSALQVHEVVLSRFDVRKLAAVQVTTPLRTAVDLLFVGSTPAGWPDPLQAIAALRRYDPALTPALLEHALQSRYRAPFKRRALARLQRLD